MFWSQGGSEQFQIFQKFYKEKPLLEEDFLRKMNYAESPEVFSPEIEPFRFQYQKLGEVALL